MEEQGEMSPKITDSRIGAGRGSAEDLVDWQVCYCSGLEGNYGR